jgi:uncharacterized protein (DUF305 family)
VPCNPPPRTESTRVIRWKVRGPVTAALLTVMAVAACTRAKDAAPGDTSQAAHQHAGMGAEPVIPPGAQYTAADVKFMQGMIAHHAQAIEMAHMAKSHGAKPKMLTFTLKIDLSQRVEIDRMQGWLRDHNQPVPDTLAHHGMSMPGMLTPDQMKQLDAAKGADFDRLFLELMILHHEGALMMVDELFATPKAASEPDVYSLATDIRTDQTAEIELMREMLKNP